MVQSFSCLWKFGKREMPLRVISYNVKQTVLLFIAITKTYSELSRLNLDNFFCVAIFGDYRSRELRGTDKSKLDYVGPTVRTH